MTQVFRALLVHILVFAIAVGVIWSASYQGVQSAIGGSVFVICGCLAFAIQWLAFIPAYLRKTEHFYDLTGGLTYLFVVVFALSQNDSLDFRSILLTVLVSIWAIRLAGFLFLRVRNQGSDSRFDEIKLNFWRFSIAWTVQGLWVLITAGAAVAAITSSHKAEFGWLGGLGLLLWIVGFSIEAIADNQKRIFRLNKNSQTEFIQTGLWAYSRHPNYFGEILLWTGIAIIAYPALYEWQNITLISPVFVAILLIKISGISLQEEQANERWADNLEYQAYKSRTPALIPRLTKA